ncbi:integral peroxisomal membrane peroxin-domain-containing protein [Lactarius pseudohatsudake]|nr:integral peroxisomal membrane peroxin-domain-containing protein [Lactarius pseudohatsudake]
MHKRTGSQPQPQAQATSTTAAPVITAEPSQILPEPANEQTGGGGLAGSSTLIDFLHSVPTPLVALLVRLAPSVSYLRRAAQIVSWQSSWVDSWLILATWWALVIFVDPALRYFLPLVIVSAVAYFRRRQPPKDTSQQPITEAAIQAALKDLASLHILLPSLPAFPTSLSPSILPSISLLRACAIAFIPYLILTYLIPVRVLVGLIGTILLTYRAPFARLLRAALWRSAFVRWALYRSWAVLSGIPMPSSIPSPALGAAANTTIAAKFRFAFMVYENQRWWMGLDWTAALLPGERPSWCSASQAPLSPPAAFALPAPTTVFLPVDGVPDAREKRTATWTWAEPEWQVIVHRDGEPSTAVDGVENLGETDADGWVYGDNKWESHSSKGGIGKYTRHRRWTRVAFLTETTERVGPGPTGVSREDGDLRPLDTLPNGDSKEKQKIGEKESEKRDKSPGDSTFSNDRRKSTIGLGVVGGGIKQRLHAAVSGSH